MKKQQSIFSIQYYIDKLKKLFSMSSKAECSTLNLKEHDFFYQNFYASFSTHNVHIEVTYPKRIVSEIKVSFEVSMATAKKMVKKWNLFPVIEFPKERDDVSITYNLEIKGTEELCQKLTEYCAESPLMEGADFFDLNIIVYPTFFILLDLKEYTLSSWSYTEKQLEIDTSDWGWEWE